MIKEAIVKIVNKGDLSYDEAYAVMNEIMNGETSPTQNAAFLAALSTKSTKAETIDEIAGCAAAMREHAVKVETGMDIFEIVGTGGDNAQSFNISTTSALVAAAGGMKVAKHGNRQHLLSVEQQIVLRHLVLIYNRIQKNVLNFLRKLECASSLHRNIIHQ